MISNRIQRRGAAGASAAAIVVLLLSTFACGGYAAAPDTLAESSTLEQLTAFAGGEAERCVFSAPDRQLCTWLVQESDPGWTSLSQTIGSAGDLNLVCEVPIDGGSRGDDSCSTHPRALGTIAATTGLPAVSAASDRASAEMALATATTVVSLSHLLGNAPDECRTGPGIQTCAWTLEAGAPGYERISALSDADETIVLSCTLPLDGSSRQNDSCQTS